MPRRTLGLYLTWIAMVWLWMDFLGLLLSTISTSFFVRWASAPGRTTWLFLIAVFAFSGPLFYRWLSRVESPHLMRVLLTCQACTYLSLSACYDHPWFGWGVVFGAWLSSLTAVGALSRLNHFPSATDALRALLLGALLYNLARDFNDGVLTLFIPNLFTLSGLLIVIVLALVLPHLRLHPQISTREMSRTGVVYQTGKIYYSSEDLRRLGHRRSHWPNVYASAFGPMLGLSFGLLYNLPLWTAKTPGIPNAFYLMSFGVGSLLGLAFIRQVMPQGITIPMILSLLSMSNALYFVLYLPYSPAAGLLAHGSGCFGMTALWALFLRRYHEFSRKSEDRLPSLGLLLGFIGFLFHLLLFLRYSSTIGFWIALFFSLSVLALVEWAQSFDSMPQQKMRVGFTMAFTIMLLSGIFHVVAPAYTMSSSSMRAKTPPNAAHAHTKAKVDTHHTLTVELANIRYGWNEALHFHPNQYLMWQAQQPSVDILGIQEINKGHTAGGYMDLFQWYQSHLPGYWHYGNAHYGFGNALRTSTPQGPPLVRRYQKPKGLPLYQRRGWMRSTIRRRSHTIALYLTQLTDIVESANIAASELSELLQQLQKEQKPWLLMIGTTLPIEHPTMQSLRRLAHPLFQRSPQQDKHTRLLLRDHNYPAAKPSLRADYIFFSPHFHYRSFKIHDNQGHSDHRPLRLTLTLPHSAPIIHPPRLQHPHKKR